MLMKDIILTRIDDHIRGSEEAMRFMGEIIKNFPQEVFEIEIDDTAPARKAIVVGSGACKFGVYPEITQAFIEYYASCDGSEPEMALYIDAQLSSVDMHVCRSGRTMEIKFFVDDGEVKKIMKAE